jgi:hypothetical protein
MHVAQRTAPVVALKAESFSSFEAAKTTPLATVGEDQGEARNGFAVVAVYFSTSRDTFVGPMMCSYG